MSLQIFPLGTNGFFSSFGRQTACYLLIQKNTLIILDAGSGLFRLAEPFGKKLLSESKEIYIFLSHYHLDHTIGFYAAFAIFKDKRVTVFGPERKKVFAELPSLGYFPINFEEKYGKFVWQKIEKDSYECSSFKFWTRKQNHRGEICLAYKFKFSIDKTLAYITDSELSYENISFVQGVDCLFHEHWFSGEEVLSHLSNPKEKIGKKSFSDLSSILYSDGHATTTGAAIIAKEAEVGKLILIHHHPFLDNIALNKRKKIAQIIFPDTSVALDLRPIRF